jgi:hypothetical protein
LLKKASAPLEVKTMERTEKCGFRFGKGDRGDRSSWIMRILIYAVDAEKGVRLEK